MRTVILDAMRISILLVTVSSLACSGPQQRQEQTYAQRAETAYAAAVEALEDGDYTVALARFREVRDGFELSPYAILAELRLADTYFEQGTTLQAAEAYRQFIQLHPSHDAVPYARFRIGMSYFEDMPSSFFLLPPSYERELGSTRLAHDMIGEFIARYRDSEDDEVQSYIRQAQEAYVETSDRLAGYELYVAEFYLKRERPIASAEHLQTLIAQYPSSTLAPQAKFLLARCYLDLSDVISALTTIRQLQIDHPDHKLTTRALRWMERYGLSFDLLGEES
ncbi:MAG: tetratricopeptide repeat protein [Bradymonadales bacterium]|nr:tetratricopeptide repeat protein [Bradymonadales bacterium]